MPSAVPELSTYERPPATKEKLEYVDLAYIDVSKFNQPGGKEELVDDLRKAIEQVGFFIVVGHGIKDEEVVRQLSIGQAFFKLPLEEKRQHPCNFEIGHYYGYREPKELYQGTNVRNPVEMLNNPKRGQEILSFPFLDPYREAIDAFSLKVHARILDPLLRLFSLLLELPEGYLADPHAYDEASEDHLRYMIYNPLSAADSKQIGNQYSKGHTDFGLLTILFPQIVNALQVQVSEDEYKYVPYIKDGIVVNTAEVLTFISGGLIKSTVHRVVRPPVDQADHHRLGLLYFSRPANEFPIKIAPSPLLQRLGIYDPAKEDPNPPKGLAWTRARVGHSHYKPLIENTDPRKAFEFAGHTVQLEYVSPPVEQTPVVAASA